MSRDERRELLGYEPDGQPTRMSLNYIDVTIANNYQLAAITAGKKPSNAPQSPNDDEPTENPTDDAGTVATASDGTKKEGNDNADE